MFNLALSTNDLEKDGKLQQQRKSKLVYILIFKIMIILHFINLNLLPEITSFSAAMHALNA